MKRLVQFVAALTAVLSLTACAAEVGTGVVTSEPLPCVTAETEEKEDTSMLDKDIVKSTITSTDDGNGNYTNPVIFADVPDIDIIRVDDAFYMVSTTMHLSPGCPVMRSYDLVNWEIVNYVFDTLEDRDNLALRNGENNYGKGQWATTLRYNDGVYYAGFTSFSTGRTYIYHTDDIENGKWDRFVYDECFHDMSLLFDDDGRVYIYCGYQGSYMCELKDNMYEAVPGSYKLDIIPTAEPHRFFEACSPRKINRTYYLIYSPQRGSCLDYATSDSPTGPFTYRGTIIDNGIDFPGGNDHGSVCCVNGQWYIFYHRMTNGTIMSRRGCVERIEILPDGTIPQVEMTSLGFEESLNPYDFTQADTACVLKGGCYITETSVFERPIVNVTDGCVMGWKYFDFGEDFASKTMQIRLKLRGTGSRGRVHVRLDSEDGEELGTVDFAEDSGTAGARIKAATGRHAVFLVAESGYEGWFAGEMKGRQLFMLDGFVIMK